MFSKFWSLDYKWNQCIFFLNFNFRHLCPIISDGSELEISIWYSKITNHYAVQGLHGHSCTDAKTMWTVRWVQKHILFAKFWFLVAHSEVFADESPNFFWPLAFSSTRQFNIFFSQVFWCQKNLIVGKNMGQSGHQKQIYIFSPYTSQMYTYWYIYIYIYKYLGITSLQGARVNHSW